MAGKYHNNPVIDPRWGRFDSTKEYNRWLDLLKMQERGEISGLDRQVTFTLIPSQPGDLRDERPCKYRADHVYYDRDGNKIVEDVKGDRPADYIIKRKLMRYIHGIEIVEV